MNIKLAIIGDYNSSYRLHRATNDALSHSMDKTAIKIYYEWIATDTIETDFRRIISEYNGFWIAPGGPYKSRGGVLSIIKYARENKIPVLGTCSGFQHIALEFAQNVLGIKKADHAEYNPDSEKLIITPLSCSYNGERQSVIIINKSSRTYRIFKQEIVDEQFHCKFGLNHNYAEQFNLKGFNIVATDNSNEARILELKNHPFFIATLFVPQYKSTIKTPHSLVTELLISCQNKISG